MTRRTDPKPLEIDRILEALGDADPYVMWDIDELKAADEESSAPDDVSDNDAVRYALNELDAAGATRVTALREASDEIRRKLDWLKEEASAWTGPAGEEHLRAQVERLWEERDPFRMSQAMRASAHPAASRLEDVTRGSAEPSVQESEHLEECDHCQQVIAAAWRERCPGPSQLLLYYRSPARFPYYDALRVHLDEDGCRRCGLVVTTIHRTAAVIERLRRASLAATRDEDATSFGFEDGPLYAFSGTGRPSDAGARSRPTYVVDRHDDATLVTPEPASDEAVLAVEVPLPQARGARAALVRLAALRGEMVLCEEQSIELVVRDNVARGTVSLGGAEDVGQRLGPVIFVSVELVGTSPGNTGDPLPQS